MFPTADQIAIAIVTASRIEGADPIAVAKGERDPPGNNLHRYPIARARTYAAFGLALVFPDVTESQLAFVCGCTRAGCQSFFGNKRGVHWYDPKHAEQVAHAVRAKGVPDRIEPDGYVPAPRKSRAGHSRPKGVPKLAQDADRGGKVDTGRGTSESPPIHRPQNGSAVPRPPMKPPANSTRPAATVIPAAGSAGSSEYARAHSRSSLAGYSAEEERGLARRANERRTLSDLLREAAANTAAMQRKG